MGLVVEPRTMESSTTATLLSAKTSGSGLYFRLMPISLSLCSGWMKVRPI